MLQRIIDGRTDLVFDYLSAGNDARARDLSGTPLICWCAYHGDVSALRYLVANGESLNSLGPNFDLNGAAFHGHWQLCQFLIENGAHPDYALGDTAERPLHAALSRANRPNHDFVVEVLLDAGADPNSVTNPGIDTGSFMRDCRTKAESPLHRAAAYGSARSIARLLESGASREMKDMHGDSPLTWASWHLRPASILRMLSYSHYTIHEANHSTYDHGVGWEQPLGKPHAK